MNTNQLKRFAQEARRKLLQQVGAKLEYVLTHDTAELREKAKQIKMLQDELNRVGKNQLIEKVAYTWFNRLMALRFMDANDYQPSGIRIVSPKDGYTMPQILDEAKQGHFPDGISVDKQKVLDILDGRIPSKNPQNEAFRVLLIAACNALHKQFSFLFERINDYTELLLPDDLTSEFSIVHDIVEGMTSEDCQHVEIIGWLYQFYISEKKDGVFASKGKVKKEDIPAATQLFTPRWIVEYMVQNTLGKLWLQNRANSRLREYMPYFIESASLQSDDYLQFESVEEIKLLDQACGSGHILVYAFELLTKIYEEEGYNPSDIPKLIIEKNLHGYEIDERAAQLAGFSLLMKARGYYRRLFRKDIKPNILCFEDVRFNKEELMKVLVMIYMDKSSELQHDLKLMEQITNFGSLIQPHAAESLLQQGMDAISEVYSKADVFERNLLERFGSALKQLHALAGKFHCVVDNPPYMGGSKMNTALSQYVKEEYLIYKSDISTCFIQSALNTLYFNGYLGMVTLDSWMFLSTFEKARHSIFEQAYISTLIHVGWNCFPEGHVYNRGSSFALIKNNSSVICKGNYINLSNVPATVDKENLFITRLNNKQSSFNISIENLKELPGFPLGYWLSETARERLNNSSPLIELGKAVKGLDTCDNDRFVRYWYEVSRNRISIQGASNTKWYVYQKGGEFRKWFGNTEKVVNWENNGYELINFKNPDGSQKSRPQNISKYFKLGITWSSVGSGEKSYRILNGSIFGGGGNGYFTKSENIHFILGFLNSQVSKYFLNLFNPTINNLAGDIHKIPIIGIYEDELVQNNVRLLVEISKLAWDSNEISCEFLKDPTLQFKAQDISEAVDLFKEYWTLKIKRIKNLEEKINLHFIELYGLENDLSPEILLEQISILKEVTKKNKGILSFQNDEVIKQFISYSIGCVFGRCSLDKQGLILANQGESLADYMSQVDKPRSVLSYLPDDDAIVPVLDDEWFEDDIVGRFYEFLKVTYDERDFQKNLAFVEEALSKDIRNYFVRDFYNDHIKRYKKRPIYWMFSSPKGSFNVLIYLHRYTPDTINNILNNYLREFIQKLKSQKQHYQNIQVSGTTREQNQATKQIDKLDKMILDCEEYERDILYPLATERIAIDLDDGVLVNYNKFGKAVKEVKGLNDKKAKEKVRKFDWIDVTQIRD